MTQVARELIMLIANYITRAMYCWEADFEHEKNDDFDGWIYLPIQVIIRGGIFGYFGSRDSNFFFGSSLGYTFC